MTKVHSHIHLHTEAGPCCGLEHTALPSVVLTPELHQKYLLMWGPYNTDCWVSPQIFPVQEVWGGAQVSEFLACSWMKFLACF